MSDDNFLIKNLKLKRAEIATTVLDLETQLNQARQYLAHVDGTLRLYGQELYPKAPGRRSGLKFQRNELARFVLRQLQNRPAGLTARALSEAMMAEKGWNTADDSLLQALI